MDEQYLENLYFDLANKFDEWYQANSQGIWGNPEKVSIVDILRKIDLTNRNNGKFVYNDITIHFFPGEQTEGEITDPNKYSASVWHTNTPPNQYKLSISIDFTDDGWVYSHDISTHYEYNRHGRFYSQDRDNKMGKWKERVKKAEEAELRTRSGLKYGLPYGQPYNRGGRKSRKSRKNKKQKNRKTNRR